MRIEKKIEALKILKASIRQGLTSGLCSKNNNLFWFGFINKTQYLFIKRLIKKEIRLQEDQVNKFGGFIWRKESKAPRLRWINDKIKELESQL